MSRVLSGGAAAIFLTLLATPSSAQQATEQFIPLGQSPGISKRYSYIGTIVGIDAAARTVTLEAQAGARVIRLTPQTRIWLDRSGHGLTNRTGRFEDLQSGRRAEVKYADQVRRDAADWIKVVPEHGN